MVLLKFSIKINAKNVNMWLYVIIFEASMEWTSGHTKQLGYIYIEREREPNASTSLFKV